VANITASRVSSEKIRKLRVFLAQRYYSLDYQDQEIKGYRLEADALAEGGRRIVKDDLPVERAEPLRRELEAFVAACRGESAPLVDGQRGRQALETALAVGRAIAETARRN
jgi:predicted dehydrogenase